MPTCTRTWEHDRLNDFSITYWRAYRRLTDTIRLAMLMRPLTLPRLTCASKAAAQPRVSLPAPCSAARRSSGACRAQPSDAGNGATGSGGLPLSGNSFLSFDDSFERHTAAANDSAVAMGSSNFSKRLLQGEQILQSYLSGRVHQVLQNTYPDACRKTLQPMRCTRQSQSQFLSQQ